MRLLQKIKKEIDLATYEELVEAKKYLLDVMYANLEITDRSISRFYIVVNDNFLKYERNAPISDKLIELSKLTEAEFSRYRKVGKLTIQAAKSELNKYGLHFKQPQ